MINIRDINKDGGVNTLDLSRLIFAPFPCKIDGAPGDPTTCVNPEGRDLNLDGGINTLDLSLLIFNPFPCIVGGVQGDSSTCTTALSFSPAGGTITLGAKRNINVVLENSAGKKLTSFQVVFSYNPTNVNIENPDLDITLGSNLPSGWIIQSKNITGTSAKIVSVVASKTLGDVLSGNTNLISFNLTGIGSTPATPLTFNTDPIMGTIASDINGQTVPIVRQNASYTISL